MLYWNIHRLLLHGYVFYLVQPQSAIALINIQYCVEAEVVSGLNLFLGDLYYIYILFIPSESRSHSCRGRSSLFKDGSVNSGDGFGLKD